MRLDKFLSSINIGTRSQVKEYIRKGQVTVNGSASVKADLKVDEVNDIITFCGSRCVYRQYVYYMLNKPSGVVTAVHDKLSDTVMDLMADARERSLFPVGRLDKDTEGLLLITNDGELAHRLLSPSWHVDKTYVADIGRRPTDDELQRLEKGVDIGDESPTLPAVAEMTGEGLLQLTIREGRYHQVKRMLAAVDNEVVTLKRISFGPLKLDPSLKPGESRELTQEEICRIRAVVQNKCSIVPNKADKRQENKC